MCSRSSLLLDANIETSKQLPIDKGEQTSISCSNNLVLSSDSPDSITCGTEGGGDAATLLPRCVFPHEASCGSLPDHWDHLVPSVMPVETGKTVELTCENGYKLMGSSTVTCKAKSWTWVEPNPPSCRKFYYFF